MTLIYIILGLLILGLIGFGGSQVGQGNINSFGSVGKEPLRINEYANSLRAQEQQFAQLFGRRLSQQEAEQFGLVQSALDLTVNNAALDNENSRIGLSVGDDAVSQEIATVPQFQTLAGEFDRVAYADALRRINMSVPEYEDNIRRTNARSIVQLMLSSGAVASEDVAKNLLSFAQETRDVEWGKIDASFLTEEIAKPSAEELQAYYEANPEAYTAPEIRKIEYVLLTPTMRSEAITIDDATLKEAYEDQRDRFNQPARRAVDRLIFPDLASAEDARNRLDAGSITFDDLIAERGLSIEDVDLGEVAATDLASQASDLIFATNDLGVVGPAQSDLGPALYRVNASFDAVTRNFAQAYEELNDELARDQARRDVLSSASQIQELLAAGLSLSDIAKDAEMEFGNIDYSNESSDGIAAYEEFRSAANAAQLGDFPELLDLSDGGIFAMELKEIVPPTIIPFDDVKIRVQADLESANRVKALIALGDKLGEELRQGTSFETLGIEANSFFDVTRDAFLEGAPQELVSILFEAELNSASSITQIAQGEEVFFAKLLDVKSPDLSSDAASEQIQNATSRIGSQIGNELMSAFARELSKDASIDQNLLNQINAQILVGQ